MPSRSNLILTGFMGSGKSAIGRIIAHRLRFQFLDTDTLVSERAGMDIPEIFARHGEAHFRELETRAIESLAGLDRYVIATGGGSALGEGNRALLRALGFVVLLTAREDILFDRVSRTTKRPLLHTEDPRATVAALLAERQPAYDAAAHWTLDTSNLDREAASDAVVAAAREAFGWR
ncbi:MAG: shikimate kinase [Chthoniobacteraceae bacterium]